MLNNFYVYVFLRKDGTPYYVGKGHGKRAFNASRRFHPRDLTRIQIVKDNLDEPTAFNLEKSLVAKYGRKDLGTGILHNHTDGGEGTAGYTLNEKQRKVRSIISKNQSAVTRAKISATLKGRKFSKSTLIKMKRSAVIRSASEIYRTMMSKAKKASMTTEVKKKISLGLKGKTKSETHREHLREAWKFRLRGEKRNEESKKHSKVAQQNYWSTVTRFQCPHCGKTVVERFYYKWHGENCKKNVR
jgi:predicted RNA-binding Zn-ribbon protein involved in translation (DUF1610 family)